MQIFDLEQLREIERRNDARLIFHGTSSCFSKQIEDQGWPMSWRPYKWDEVEFLLNLGEELAVGHPASIYLEVNHMAQCEKVDEGPYFTYLLEGAVQYAEYTGGETIRCAFERAKFLLGHLSRVRTDRVDEVEKRLRSLMERWSDMITTSSPVVYLIEGNERTFPQLLPQQIQAFEWQIREWGEVTAKDGNFRSRADIPAEDIVGKAVLPLPGSVNR
ncbi:MAG: hypothetical protein ACLFRP_03605 [Puniceicoccaceae bacterium]